MEQPASERHLTCGSRPGKTCMCGPPRRSAGLLAAPDTLPGMRSSDAIAPRRRPSPWAWLVTGSAVVVAGLRARARQCGGWRPAATRIATYSVTGAVNRITLDLGGADATVLGGGVGPGGQVRAPTSSPSAAAPRPARVSGGVLRLRSRCPATCSRRARRATASGSRQHPRDRAHELGRRTLQRLSRLGEHRDEHRRHLGRGLLRLPAERGPRAARPREHVVLAGAARAALALGRHPGDRPGRPLPRRRRHRHRHAPRRGADPAEDAPFQIQALRAAGDVDVETP